MVVLGPVPPNTVVLYRRSGDSLLAFTEEQSVLDAGRHDPFYNDDTPSSAPWRTAPIFPQVGKAVSTRSDVPIHGTTARDITRPNSPGVIVGYPSQGGLPPTFSIMVTPPCVSDWRVAGALAFPATSSKTPFRSTNKDH